MRIYDAAFAAWVVIFSIIFLGESITTTQVIAIAIIFLGLLFCTFDIKALKKGWLANKGIFWAFIAMFSHGIYFTFIKIPVRELGWFWPAMISLSLSPLLLLFMKVRKIRLVKPNHKGAIVPVIMNAILLTGAEFAFNSGISKGLTAIVAPIAGSYPTLFVVLAFLIFKDPITRQQITGIVIALIGVVFLSISSA